LGRAAGRLADATAWQWVFVVLPTVVFVALAWQSRWVSDDGFMHLRVVDQLVHGNGPVFNARERIEASTSPLWVAMLALAYWLPGPSLPWKSVLLGIGVAAAGLVAAQRAAVRLARPADGTGAEADGEATEGEADAAETGSLLVLPVGAVALLGLRPFWEYATSGLETGLVFGWLGACCWWAARRATAPERPRLRVEAAGAVLVGLGSLVRPDLAVFTVTFGAVLLAAVWPRGWRARIGWLAAGAAVPLAYQVFRMGYYAMIVPNTAVAKEAGHTNWSQGWEYLVDLVSPYVLWLPIGIAVALVAAQAVGDLRAGGRLRAAARLAPEAGAVLHTLYIVRVGGDFMHARLLLPGVFALLAPLGLPIPRRGRPAPATVAAAIVLATWAVVSLLALRVHYERTHSTALPLRNDGTIEDERALTALAIPLDYPVAVDEYALYQSRRKHTLPPRGVLVGRSDVDLNEIRAPLRDDFSQRYAGTVPSPAYAWGPDVYVLDVGALGDPVASHLYSLGGDRPAHQKPMPPAWQFANRTSASQVLGPDGGVVVSARDLGDAERAESCGQLGEYLEDVRAPLTPRRFLGNILDSFANTSLRVPRDPGAAVDALCDEES
jgi:arabinofuranosyltransferase